MSCWLSSNEPVYLNVLLGAGDEMQRVNEAVWWWNSVDSEARVLVGLISARVVSNLWCRWMALVRISR